MQHPVKLGVGGRRTRGEAPTGFSWARLTLLRQNPRHATKLWIEQSLLELARKGPCCARAAVFIEIALAPAVQRSFQGRLRAVSGSYSSMAASPGGPAVRPRLVITEMVLENFKSYAGEQRIGPFHKVGCRQPAARQEARRRQLAAGGAPRRQQPWASERAAAPTETPFGAAPDVCWSFTPMLLESCFRPHEPRWFAASPRPCCCMCR